MDGRRTLRSKGGMTLLTVERIGGIAGFGAPGHLRSRGQIESTSLAQSDQESLERLFGARAKAKPSAMRDGFSYRISRNTPSGTETIEVSEAMVPAAIAACVKDELV